MRPEDIRASDVDRKATQERLQWAHDEGLISLQEFDTRVREAWDSRTHGELSKVTADLPAPPKPPRKPYGPFSATGGGVAMRVLSTIWLSLSLVNLVVWGLLVVTLGHWVHPWWVWVAGPPGAVLFVLWWSGIGRRHPD
jgi:Domain of unknown function (DUF1707)